MFDGVKHFINNYNVNVNGLLIKEGNSEETRRNGFHQTNEF